MNILDAGIKSSIESRSFLKTKTGDMTETIVVRMAHSDDYPNILALQKANQIGNLTEAERKNGFLSAEIPEERIGALASDTGIVVAYDQAEFAGFSAFPVSLRGAAMRSSTRWSHRSSKARNMRRTASRKPCACSGRCA